MCMLVIVYHLKLILKSRLFKLGAKNYSGTSIIRINVGEGYLDNRKVRKIEHPYIYILYTELCSTTLIKHTLVDKIQSIWCSDNQTFR